jgi:phosphoribosylanthranilate isomerase
MTKRVSNTTTWDLSRKNTRIKLCEFESLDSAYEASFIGADFLGFHIFAEQDYLEKANRFKQFFDYLPAHVEKTLLSDCSLDVLFEILSIAPFDSIQLYNDCPVEDIQAIREKMNHRVKILKVMSAQSEENSPCNDDEFIAYYDQAVDAFLLDSYRVGGTGKTGDWDHCAEIVKKCTSPVFLAGGLTPENVYEAIRRVRPFGVDVENGVSTRMPDGIRLKNMMKCRLFIENVCMANTRLMANKE